MEGDVESTVKEFWNKHFVYKEVSTSIIKENCWNFFNQIHGYKINYHSFTSITGKVGIRSKTAKKKKRCYLATPITREGKKYFKDDVKEDREEDDGIDYKGEESKEEDGNEKDEEEVKGEEECKWEEKKGEGKDEDREIEGRS